MLFFYNGARAQNVGIGINTPNATVILELNSNSRGFLPTRLTTAERNAIVAPAEGLVIYNTTINCIEFYDRTNWQSLCGAPPAAPAAGNSGLVCAGNNLTLTASNIAGATYSWTGPGGFTSTQQNPVISGITTGQAGVYSVVASVGACSSVPASTTVVVNSGPIASVTCTSGSRALPSCGVGSVTLQANPGAPATWLWSTGATTQSITINSANIYTVTVTNSGCSSSASYSVSVTATPNTAIFSTPGPTTFTVPVGITSITVKAWGAGGGGGWSNGGAGGYVTGTISVTPGQVINLSVGGDGGSCSGTNCTQAGAAGIGGGGAGGNGGTTSAGGGGGATWIGPTLTPLLVAAGGGGAGNRCGSAGSGGPGGGPNGGAGLLGGAGTTPGLGATTIAGGTAGTGAGAAPTAGTSLQGGQGGDHTGTSGGGGSGGAGGGSSYATGTGTVITGGTQNIPGGIADPNYTGTYGYGGQYDGPTDGRPGYVRICW